MKVERLTSDEAEQYLARIHYTGSREPTIEALSELQRCHMLSIPFENLSVFGKEKIILTKDWLFDKIMRRHRGGFCYELNTMFSLLLDYFGFKHQKHTASVFAVGTGILGPPSHMVITANIEGELWLTDVGFGDTFRTPLRFTGLADDHQEQQSGTYRLRQDGDKYIYEEKVKTVVGEFGREEREKEPAIHEGDTDWAPRNRFDLIPRNTEDFHEWLIYHQTDDRSPFTHGRFCTLAKPWGRVTLSGSKLVTTTFLGDNKVKKETRELVGGEEEVVNELEQKFGIGRDVCLYPEGSMFIE